MGPDLPPRCRRKTSPEERQSIKRLAVQGGSPTKPKDGVKPIGKKEKAVEHRQGQQDRGRATTRAPVPPLHQTEEGRPRTKEGRPAPLHPQVLDWGNRSRMPASGSQDPRGDMREGPPTARGGELQTVQAAQQTMRAAGKRQRR
jgi:hypothetical protein